MLTWIIPHINKQTKSEADLRRLFNEAGIREEHLKNHKTSQKIFDIIEKRGGIEAVRKEVCEMASSGTSSPHPSLQSLSSSPLMSSKNKPIRWSYLFPACHQNPRVLACKSSCSLSAGTELPHFPPPPSPLSFNCVRSDNIDSPSSALPIGQLSSTNISLQPRPPLPSPPLSPPFTYNSQTVTMPVAAPSPPTSCFRRATQVVRYGQASQVTQLGIKSNKLPVLDQSQFLDEIKKGIHLKSVDPASETPQPSNDGGIVAALMEVIQKRHKAIFSSGDEASEDEDEWED
ncbi:neural Wiskott-Aldrich syndrome protein isoform X2 [Microcaecilia unicolor]|uniref:Neural Wiskott-Aldrich syndrome protein-like isoform X2 n=1 Tax=Microcaecilia unicolor TaxID=1415580 RepID=A0A6P7YCJ4_9AMPH|nr:neural Wiskott-Aldrich syndrome protein-like isoform X2 [Microcaecilia unicolor]